MEYVRDLGLVTRRGTARIANPIYQAPTPVNTCTYNDRGPAAGAARYSRETANCMLGNGGTATAATGPADSYTGKRSSVANGGTIVRPAASGTSVEVTFTLWGNGSGHFTTDPMGNPRLGHAGGPALTASYSAALAATGPGSGQAIPDKDGPAGLVDCHLGSPEGWRATASASSVVRPIGSEPAKEVTMTLDGENFVTTGTVEAKAEVDHHDSVQGVSLIEAAGAAPPADQPGFLQWLVEVKADDERCLPENDDPDRGSAQTITFTVTQLDGVIPEAPAEPVETAFTVNCPDDSAAGRGAELVPENPFPVDK